MKTIIDHAQHFQKRPLKTLSILVGSMLLGIAPLCHANMGTVNEWLEEQIREVMPLLFLIVAVVLLITGILQFMRSEWFWRLFNRSQAIDDSLGVAVSVPQDSSQSTTSSETGKNEHNANVNSLKRKVFVD